MSDPLPSAIEIGFARFKADLAAAGAYTLAETDRTVSAEFFPDRVAILGGKSVVADVFIYESKNVAWTEGGRMRRGSEVLEHPWCLMLTFLDHRGNALGQPMYTSFPTDAQPEVFRQFCLGALRGELTVRLQESGISPRPVQPAKPEPTKLQRVPSAQGLEKLRLAEAKRARKSQCTP